MSQTVRIEGLADVLTELEKRGIQANKVLEPLARAAGRLIMLDARARTHASIAKALRVTTTEKKRNAVTVVVSEGRDKKSKGYVGWFLEFGTPAHFVKARKAKALLIDGQFRASAHPGGHAAQPFMRPAFDTKKEQASILIVKGVKDALEAD
jgi:HK97 gp10 family phage protein